MCALTSTQFTYMKSKYLLLIGIALCAFTMAIESASAQGSAFTYQGKLSDNLSGTEANGSYDLKFALFDVVTNGAAVGGPLTNTAVHVANGLFTVTLDFGGGVFTGSNLWLEIAVRTNGGGAFTTLNPRQQVGSAPYALRAAMASGVAPGVVTSLGSPDGSPAVAVQVNTNGWLGVGTTQPMAQLDVKGNVLVENTELVKVNANRIELGVGPSAPGTNSIAMGSYTLASGYASTAMGEITTASGEDSTAMGFSTLASGGMSTAMGYGTIASGERSTAMGGDTAAGGPDAFACGFFTSAGGAESFACGLSTYAAGNASFTAGKGSRAMHDNCFVWADGQFTNFSSTSSNQFLIRAAGGVGIGVANPTNALHVAGGVSATAFVTTSDRNAKENFSPVSPQEVLSKIAALPISKWNFKEMHDGAHMGPTAQDFHAAFGLGGSDTTITTVDADGVALAAIQALNELVQKQDARIARLEQEISDLKSAQRRAGKKVTGDW
jgi:Chaperone of endosialidase/Head domain of trimeric autotransporter adhesin